MRATLLKTLQHRRDLARDDERGAALVTVLIISIFVFTVVLATASATALSLQTSTNQKEDIKAFAFAEAGRDAALAELVSSRCTPTGTSTTAPNYTYRIFRYKATGAETPRRVFQPGTTTLMPNTAAGCPAPDTTHVLVESVGKDRHDKTIVATYKWNAATSTVLFGALVSGSSSNISGAGVVLPLGATLPGDVVVGDGDLKCSNSIVQGSVYIIKGSLDLQGCNRISGNASSFGYMKFANSGARVVDGNACTRSYFDNYGAGKVGGTARSYQATCPGLDLAPWNDYDPDLTNAVNLPSTACNGGSALKTFIENRLTPTVINANNCSRVSITTSLSLRTDVSIVSNGFVANNPGAFTSADGARHLFNLIVPDKVRTTPADAHCSAGQQTSDFRQLDMELPMSGMIYSPCLVSFQGGTGNWTGQLQVGATSNVNALVTYVPISAPLDPVITFGTASPTLLSQVEP